MQHLDAERLAALDHEPPTLDELAHLAACGVCRAERDAYAALVRMAQHATHGAADADAPRLTSWDALSTALREEGLLTSTADITPMRTPVAVRPLVTATLSPDDQPTPSDELAARRSPRGGSFVRGRTLAGWARAAAAITLMASSAAVGRLSAGWNSGIATVDAPNAAVVMAQPVVEASAYTSIGEATTALSRAQNEYERASLWLASNDTTTRSSDVYRARLAALDQMMAASKAALRDAPQDPVLNHYFLSAYTAREATLQQLGGALPVDRTIETY